MMQGVGMETNIKLEQIGATIMTSEMSQVELLFLAPA